MISRCYHRLLYHLARHPRPPREFFVGTPQAQLVRWRQYSCVLFILLGCISGSIDPAALAKPVKSSGKSDQEETFEAKPTRSKRKGKKKTSRSKSPRQFYVDRDIVHYNSRLKYAIIALDSNDDLDDGSRACLISSDDDIGACGVLELLSDSTAQIRLSMPPEDGDRLRIFLPLRESVVASVGVIFAKELIPPIEVFSARYVQSDSVDPWQRRRVVLDDYGSYGIAMQSALHKNFEFSLGISWRNLQGRIHKVDLPLVFQSSDSFGLIDHRLSAAMTSFDLLWRSATRPWMVMAGLGIQVDYWHYHYQLFVESTTRQRLAESLLTSLMVSPRLILGGRYSVGSIVFGAGLASDFLHRTLTKSSVTHLEEAGSVMPGFRENELSFRQAFQLRYRPQRAQIYVSVAADLGTP